mmetsp:Transcript_69805/g.195135  ORF Transcript_69805/g.195135 Transcript_69805/m.195135 type:complete len:118 (+) Transcript_69805:3-356(+)
MVDQLRPQHSNTTTNNNATMSSSASSARGSTSGPDSPPPGYDEPPPSYDDGTTGAFVSEAIYDEDFPGQVAKHHMYTHGRPHAHTEYTYRIHIRAKYARAHTRAHAYCFVLVHLPLM